MCVREREGGVRERETETERETERDRDKQTDRKTNDKQTDIASLALLNGLIR